MEMSILEEFLFMSGHGGCVYQAYEIDERIKKNEKIRDLQKKQNFEKQLKRFLDKT